MTKCDFRIAPCGRTYFEMSMSWRELKSDIKRILDIQDSSRIYKIDLIISKLEDYKNIYLISRKGGDDNVKNS